MVLKIVLIIGLFLLYLIRFRPQVIGRMANNKEINKRMIAEEGIILTFVILQFFGLTFGSLTKQQWVPYLGICLFIFGGLFSLYSRAMLKDDYMPAISTQPPTRLITMGPFKIIRHPVYFGTLLGFIGMELVFNSPLIMIVIILLILGIKQINKEEKILSSKFSSEWAAYASQVPYKLIPLIY